MLHTLYKGDTMNNSIDPQTIYQLINQDVTLVDIRDKYQFDELHIKNFTHVSYQDFPAFISSAPKNKPIYILCYSGGLAKKLANQLRNLGYEAYYFEGGFQAFLNPPNQIYF